MTRGLRQKSARRRAFLGSVVILPTRQSQAQAFSSLAKCSLATFQDIAYGLSDGCNLESTRHIRDWGKFARCVWAGAGNDDLVGIGVHNEVSVVRHDDDLALVFRLNE